jgi:uncharacterized SAM-dependent methyltransferase
MDSNMSASKTRVHIDRTRVHRNRTRVHSDICASKTSVHSNTICASKTNSFLHTYCVLGRYQEAVARQPHRDAAHRVHV